MTKDKALEMAIDALVMQRRKYNTAREMYEVMGFEHSKNGAEKWHKLNDAINVLSAMKNNTHGLPLFGGQQ